MTVESGPAQTVPPAGSKTSNKIHPAPVLLSPNVSPAVPDQPPKIEAPESSKSDVKTLQDVNDSQAPERPVSMQPLSPDPHDGESEPPSRQEMFKRRPDSYLFFSCVTLFCCLLFWPFALLAMYYSCISKRQLRRGNLGVAYAKGKKAKVISLIIWALAASIVVILLLFLLSLFFLSEVTLNQWIELLREITSATKEVISSKIGSNGGLFPGLTDQGNLTSTASTTEVLSTTIPFETTDALDELITEG